MSEITVRVVSWNIGKSINKISDWSSELSNWTILKPDVDILFVTIQEASKNIGYGFGEALKTKMGDSYTMILEKEGTWIPFQNFTVFGYLFVKKSIKVARSSGNTQNSVCIYKRMYGISACTKPSVGIGIIVAKENKQHKLIFIGSHLPIDTKDKETLGNLDRIDAIKIINDDVILPITKELDGCDTVFWAGDMNFRMIDDVDQLDQLFKNRLSELTDFIEHARSFNPTCRYVEYDGISDYQQFVDVRMSKSGYDSKRTPSFCDRIIYKGKFEPIVYYSWPKTRIDYPVSIAYSDHEPVVLEGKIKNESPIMVGG